MRISCTSEADFRYNGEKIIEAMKEIGLNSHLNATDFAKASMRELLLFSL